MVDLTKKMAESVNITERIGASQFLEIFPTRRLFNYDFRVICIIKFCTK